MGKLFRTQFPNKLQFFYENVAIEYGSHSAAGTRSHGYHHGATAPSKEHSRIRLGIKMLVWEDIKQRSQEHGSLRCFNKVIVGQADFEKYIRQQGRTKMKTEKWLSTILVVCFMIASFAVISVKAEDAQSKIRLGAYDSRFVALACYRAENMKRIRDFMGNLNLELQKAREAKDENKLKELEAKGPAFQNLMHQQVFGNLSIPNVMETIKDRLPAIAKKTGVTLIVSKWEIQYSGPEVESVDLTLQLVDLFNIDEATRKMIEEGLKQNQKPVPVEQLLNPYD